MGEETKPQRRQLLSSTYRSYGWTRKDWEDFVVVHCFQKSRLEVLCCDFAVSFCYWEIFASSIHQPVLAINKS